MGSETHASSVRGRSPTALAFGRFARHRLGVAGAWIALLVGAGVVVVPWLSPFSPTETQPWVGARPPLHARPDCAADNEFVVGRPARTSARAARARRLSVVAVERETEEYRVGLRAGRVATIRRQAEALERLDLSAFPEAPRAVETDGSAGRPLPPVSIEVGAPPPAALFQPGERVLILRAAGPARRLRVEIELAGGRVVAMRAQAEGADGAAQSLERVSLRGETIESVRDAATGRDLTARHWMGTDELGRDLMTRIFHGGRISLLVGLAATCVSLLVGVAYGAVSGYAGGRADRIMMGTVDVLYAVPFVFLVIVLMVAFGRNIVLLFMALGAVQWLTMARIVRGQVRSLKHMPFVDAARMGGSRVCGIVFRHLLPHTVGPVVVYTSLTVPVVIMEESFLAFIGLQVQYRGMVLDSWGALIARGVSGLGQHGEKAWLLVFPALVMVLMLLSLNAVGDALRDSFDPRENAR